MHSRLSGNQTLTTNTTCGFSECSGVGASSSGVQGQRPAPVPAQQQGTVSAADLASVLR